MWNDSCAPFLVDDEQQSEADTKRLYYDWENVRKIDPSAQRPEFVFNSGQWFGTAGVLTRADFAPWLDWTMPRRLRHPELFMPGEQGVLNYLFNRKMALEELQVERRPIMRWPGHSMDGVDAKRVTERTAPPLIIHWAGMKKTRLRPMVGSDILLYFEKFYYTRLRAGNVRRLLANCRYFLTHWQHWVGVRIKQSYRRRVETLIPWGFSRRVNRSVGT
jgi:hypothetical protein